MARVTSRVDIRDHFDKVTKLVEKKTLRALDEAARVGQQTARKEQKIRDFEPEVIPAAGDWNGFSSGVRFRDRFINVYDHGSLGARGGRKVKQPGRRKETWPVKQKHRTYTAHRHPEALTEADKGIKPLRITTPARTAGRRALLNAIRR